MSVRASAVACIVALLGLALANVPAEADVFGAISLVSASPTEQADYAHDPAISGNGRYLVFDGSVGGVTGVWRRELKYENGVISHEGQLEEVAGGDAELPSISENGQYVSFTTNEGGELPNITDGLPDPEHEIGEGPTVESPNVYVRNMDLEPSAPGAFELVSAVNGSSDEPLTYEYVTSGEGEREKEARREEIEHYGSLAAGRSAISGDGRKVAFVTTGPSNLDGPGTPAMEVAVRDLDTDVTEVVSVEYDPATDKPAIDPETGLPKPVPAESEAETYGAVYGSGGPPRFAPAVPYTVRPTIGASISADGSTVAWLGQEIPEQVPTLPREVLADRYAAPLWRRIDEGPQAQTRLVTGGSDPANPACVASGETVLPAVPSPSDPCQGPFRTEQTLGVWIGSEGDVVPQLSANGDTVALIADAPLVAEGSDFGVDGEQHVNGDVYVVNMQAGLSRTQALRPLTELASGNESEVADNGPVVELGISPDGNQVAFVTRRIVFPLDSPAYVSAPLTVPGMLELYDVDLQNDTLTRVTRGYEGGPSEHPHEVVNAQAEDDYPTPGDGALSPSFTSNGDLLAFSSTASNLVFGDGNTPPLNDDRLDGSDAFVVPRIVPEAVPTSQQISSPPPNPSPTPTWNLGVTAGASVNGSVRLYVEVPGSGTLHASASATLELAPAHSSRNAKARRATLATRTVATTTQVTSASAGGLTTFVLTPSSSYRALVERRGGLPASVEVSFIAAGHPTLRQRIEVSFVRKASAHSSRRAGARARAQARKRRHKSR